MKSANIQDVIEAQPGSGYMLPFNVMFLVSHSNSGEKIKAHIKGVVYDLGRDVNVFLMENESGTKFIAKPEWLSPVPRKLGSKPKAKRKPIKGSKPWLANYVAYDPVLIVPEARVLCRDWQIRIVKRVTEYDLVDLNGHNSAVYLNTGKASSGEDEHYLDIIKVFVHSTDKKLKETKQDNHNGYEVGKWHFWDGKTSIPPVGKSVSVLVWFRGEVEPEQQPVDAAFWCWNWDNCDGDIIAFRVVS